MKPFTKDTLSTFTVASVATVTSIIVLFTWPLDIYYWRIYGNFYTETFVSNIGVLKNDFCLTLVNDGLGILRYFLPYAKPVYEYPILFLTAGVFLKVVEIVLVYNVMRRLELVPVAALMFAVFLPFSGGMMGSAPNGLMTYVNFNKTMISALLSLGGIYLLLANRPGWAGLHLAFACYLHIPYGITALIFVVAGTLWHDVPKKIWQPSAWLLSVGGLTLLPLVWQTMQLGRAVANPMGLATWYEFFNNMGIWGNDAFMMGSFLVNSLDFGIPAATYLLLRTHDHITKRLDGFIFAGLVLIGTSLTLEALHANGIFLGKASEIFISIQMRRGTWVPFVAIYIGLARMLWTIKDTKVLTYEWVIIFWSLLFWLRPYSALAIIIAGVLAVHLWQQQKSWYYFLIPTGILGLGSLYWYTYPTAYVASWQAITIQSAVILPIAIFAAGTPRITAAQGFYRIALPIVLLLSILTVRQAPTWYAHLRLLSLHGWLSPIDAVGLQRLANRDSDLSEPTEAPPYKVLKLLQKVNIDLKPVLLDPTLVSLEGRLPNLISPYWCGVLPMFSYPATSLISQHFSEVFERPFSVAELRYGWPESFHSLMAQDIQRLFDKNSIGAFVSTQFYPELNTISEVAPYYIYVR